MRSSPRVSALEAPALTLASALTLLLVAPDAAAQRKKPPAKPAAAEPPPVTAAGPRAPGVEGAQTKSMSDLMGVQAGGLTADQVGKRATMTSYQARAAQETLTAAEERTAAANTAYLPRLTLLGRYTHLSEFTPPSFGAAPAGATGSLVTTAAPDGTANPTPTSAVAVSRLFGSGTRFPLVLDQFLLQASLVVPISDYLLTINHAHTAATRSEEAARWDIVTARAKSYSDAKLSYYNWLRGRGGVGIADQSLAVAEAHHKDAQNLFTVGNASRADVLQAQTQVAAAELGVQKAKAVEALTARQVRVAMHATEDEKLVPGDSLDNSLAPPGDIAALLKEATSQRPEIKSVEKNADAARASASASNGARFPQLSAFGDFVYANPNPRRFPQRPEWFPTWDVGAQITWSPNDIPGKGAASNEAEARANALEAQKGAVRDGIDLEVTDAYQGVLQADAAIGTTARQLESAEEGYRVARELFNAGRGTSTTLLDAEAALAQARFDHLNARVDARLARVRLEHAVGRDARTIANQP